jgi:hypothetical protein
VDSSGSDVRGVGDAVSGAGASPVPLQICYATTLALVASSIAALHSDKTNWGNSLIKTAAQVFAALSIVDLVCAILLGMAWGGDWQRMQTAGYVGLGLSSFPVLLWLTNVKARQTGLGKWVMDSMKKLLGKAAEYRSQGKWHAMAVVLWVVGSLLAVMSALLWLHKTHDGLAWALAGLSLVAMGWGLVLSPVASGSGGGGKPDGAPD